MLIDGATTNTRFSLLRDFTVVASVTKRIGASSTSDSARNSALEQAVGETIADMEAAHGCRIETVVASGMITSNVGLLEVPHMEAPVRLGGLAASIRPRMLPHVAPHATFYLVPGIKFSGKTRYDRDVLRGEETELYGAIAPDDADKTLLFVHFGSHDKIILYRDGAITDAVTTLSGELLWAVLNGTILKSAVGDIGRHDVVPAYVRMGYKAAEALSFSRALFTARINQIMDGASEAESLSYIYGIIVHTDCRAFAPLLQTKAARLCLYGRSQLAQAFEICAAEFFPDMVPAIETIPYEDSERLSILGLTKICRDLAGDIPPGRNG